MVEPNHKSAWRERSLCQVEDGPRKSEACYELRITSYELDFCKVRFGADIMIDGRDIATGVRTGVMQAMPSCPVGTTIPTHRAYSRIVARNPQFSSVLELPGIDRCCWGSTVDPLRRRVSAGVANTAYPAVGVIVCAHLSKFAKVQS